MKITVTSGEEDVLSPGGKQPQIDKDDAGQEHVHDRGASPVAIQRLFAGCHFMVPWEPPLCVVVQVRLQVAGMVFIVGMKEQRRSTVGGGAARPEFPAALTSCVTGHHYWKLPAKHRHRTQSRLPICISPSSSPKFSLSSLPI